jgi:short-subunit dehydrogenase
MICPGWIATSFSQKALTATGSPYKGTTRPDSSKMSTEECARHTLKTIASGKKEALIGGKEIWGAWTSLFFPRIYDWFLHRRNEFTFLRQN